MSIGPLAGSLVRLAAGIVVGLPAAAVLFGRAYPTPAEAKFAALVAATLLATALILVRLVPHAHAAFLVAVLAGVSASVLARLTERGAVVAAVAGALVGIGAWLVAWIAGLEARRSILWRAPLAGALFGGVTLAVAPLAELGAMNLFDAVRPMLLDAGLAAVAGCGATIGVEAAGWLLAGRSD